MSKEQHTVALAGYLANGERAASHNASEVRYFSDAFENFVVRASADGNVVLHTSKGTYPLVKHPSIKNLFTGVCAGIKVHMTKKKLVGKVIYWS